MNKSLRKYLYEKIILALCLVAHDCKPSNWEVGDKKIVNWRPALAIQAVQGEPRFTSEI